LDETEENFHVMFDPVSKLRVFFQKLLDVVTSLPEAFAFIREPRTALLDDVVV